MNPPSSDQLLAEANWVRGLARRLLDDGADVDDLVQEAYLRALRTPPSDPRAIRSWFRTVVRRLAATRFRDRASRNSRERAAARPIEAEYDDLLERVEEQRRLARVVLDLEEPYRRVILLRFYDELAPAQIAEAIGLPVGTVRVQLMRGLEKLRQKLDREYGDRAAWCLALLPVARSVTPGATAGSASQVSGSTKSVWSTWFGASMGLGVVGLLWWSVGLVVLALMSSWALTDFGRSGSSRSIAIRDGVEERASNARVVGSALVADPASVSPPVATDSGSVSSAFVEDAEADCTIVGVLVDGGGRPVPDAKISITLPAILGMTWTQLLGSSDLEGRFSFQVPSGRGASQLLFRKSGFSEVEHVLKDRPTAGVEIGTVTLFEMVDCSGRVVGTDGKPIAGATVTVSEWQQELPSAHSRAAPLRTARFGTGETNRNGQFRVSIAGGAEFYRVDCEAAGWLLPAGVRTSDISEQIELTMQRLRPFRGEVHFDDGRPAVGAEVGLGFGRGRQLTHVDEEGRFQFDSPKGRGPWRLDVSHPGATTVSDFVRHAKEDVRVTLMRAGAVEFQFSRRVPELGCELRREGRVVAFHGWSELSEDRVRLDPIAHGRYRARFSGQEVQSSWIDFDVLPDQVTRVPVGLFEIAARTLQVVDGEGEPVVGARVTVLDALWKPMSVTRVTTDASGRGIVRDPRDRFGLVVEAEGFTPLVELDVLVPDTGSVVRLEPSFEVVFEFGGPGRARAERASLRLIDRGADFDRWFSVRSRRAQDDGKELDWTPTRVEDGRVTLRGLPKGELEFELFEPGSLASGSGQDQVIVRWRHDLQGPARRVIEIGRDEEVDQELRVRLGEAPAQGGRLSAFRRDPKDPQFECSFLIDARGRARSRVLPGSYSFRYYPGTDLSSWLVLHDSGWLAGQTVELTIPSVSTTLAFVDADGAPTDATGWLNNYELGRFRIEADETGVVHLPAVIPGTYSLRDGAGSQSVVIPEKPDGPIRVLVDGR